MVNNIQQIAKEKVIALVTAVTVAIAVLAVGGATYYRSKNSTTPTWNPLKVTAKFKDKEVARREAIDKYNAQKSWYQARKSY